MPRAPNGTYTAPADSFNPAIPGTTIDPTDWNATQTDYVSAITDSLSRTGLGGMQANLDHGAFSSLYTEISTPSNPSANILKLYAKDVAGITKLAGLDSAGTESIYGTASGTVTSFSSGNLSPLFTTNVATATTTPALTFTLSNAGATTYLGSIAGGAPSYVTGGSLTKTDDTNVTMILGGTPANALLSTGVSMTLGWTGILSAARGGTANGFTAFSGPATSTKTFTLPNASAIILTDNAAVTPAQGGTGIQSYALGDTLYASATNTLSKLSGNTASTKKVLTQTGTGAVSAAPVWDTTTGTGAPVLANTPLLITPDIGAATGTTVTLNQASSVFNITAATGSSLITCTTSNANAFIQLAAASSNTFTFGLLGSAAILQAPSGGKTQIQVSGGAAGPLECSTLLATAITATSLTFGGTIMSAFVEGTYTPTLFNTTNVTSSTASVCRYTRIGKTVFVWGQVIIQYTASTNTVLGMSLPVASNLVIAGDLGGAGNSRASNVNAMGIEADATNDRALFVGVAAGAVTNTIDFSFSYQVLP